MTRNPYIDIDIEAVGCGRWIEPGDAASWRHELAHLMEHPAEAAAMGARGRAHAAERWNYERYCDALIATVAEAAG